MKQLAVDTVTDLKRAGILLQPIRLDIVNAARDEPASASRIADHLGETRQKVNYHVKELADAGFLQKAGTRRRRNMIEQNYQANARAYLLAPQLLQRLDVDWQDLADYESAVRLLALSCRLQEDLVAAGIAASEQEKRLSTLSLSAELTFTSARQRARFAAELEDAVTELVSRYSAGGGRQKRKFRLLVGCYPAPEPERQGEDS